ncbi:MAG: histidine phosphatase family protein [Acidobacteriota bacterium]
MKRLILVRHGEVESQLRSDDELRLSDDENGLTEWGVARTEGLAEHLRERFEATSLLTSPLLRARQTADILARELELAPTVESRLAERDYGFPPGTTMGDSHRLQLACYEHPEDDPPHGESLASHRRRVSEWLREVETRLDAEGGVIVAVAHGGTLEQALATLQGSPLAAASRWFTRCEPASYHLLARLDVEGRKVWCLDGVDLRPI